MPVCLDSRRTRLKMRSACTAEPPAFEGGNMANSPLVCTRGCVCAWTGLQHVSECACVCAGVAGGMSLPERSTVLMLAWPACPGVWPAGPRCLLAQAGTLAGWCASGTWAVDGDGAGGRLQPLGESAGKPLLHTINVDQAARLQQQQQLRDLRFPCSTREERQMHLQMRPAFPVPTPIRAGGCPASGGAPAVCIMRGTRAHAAC